MGSWCEEGIPKLPDEFMDSLNEVSNTRRPLILFVGKPLSREEIIQLILNEEPIFKKADRMCEFDDNSSDKYYIKNEVVHKLLGDGTLYGSSVSKIKYPYPCEVLPHWTEFADRNPFIDMVIAYTTINEGACYHCNRIIDNRYMLEYNPNYDYISDSMCGYNEYCNDVKCVLKMNDELNNLFSENKGKMSCPKFDNVTLNGKELNKFGVKCLSNFYNVYKPFNHYNSIKFVLHIHKGVCELVIDEEARKRYIAYDKKYGDMRLENVFILSNTYKENNYVRITDELFRECISRVTDKEIYERVKNKHLANKTDNQILLTKQLLCDEYDKAFNGTFLEINNLNKLRDEYCNVK